MNPSYNIHNTANDQPQTMRTNQPGLSSRITTSSNSSVASSLSSSSRRRTNPPLSFIRFHSTNSSIIPSSTTKCVSGQDGTSNYQKFSSGKNPRTGCRWNNTDLFANVRTASTAIMNKDSRRNNKNCINNKISNNNSNHSSSSSSSLRRRRQQQPQSQQQKQQDLREKARRRIKRVTFASDEKNSIRNVPHINDLKLDSDLALFWYTEQDLDAIVEQCNDIVARHVDIIMELRQKEQSRSNRSKQCKVDDDDDEDNDDGQDDSNVYNNPDNDDDKEEEQEEEQEKAEALYVRGLEAEVEYELERRNPEWPSARQCHIENAREIVFEEQELQRSKGKYNDELLAKMYRRCTQASQTKAELMGLDDWKGALLLLEDEKLE